MGMPTQVMGIHLIDGAKAWRIVHQDIAAHGGINAR